MTFWRFGEKDLAVDRIEDARGCVRVRQSRDLQMRSSLEPKKESGLVPVECNRGIVHALGKEWNGGFVKSHARNEKATTSLLHHGGSWPFKLFYVNRFFVPGAEEFDCFEKRIKEGKNEFFT